MNDLWFEHDGNRHRIVVIEYHGRWPHAVVAEEHWDHSGKPWFVAGRDKPRGTVAEYWDFDYSKTYDTLYFHNSGGGGDPLDHQLGRFCEPIPPPGKIWTASD